MEIEGLRKGRGSFSECNQNHKWKFQDIPRIPIYQKVVPRRYWTMRTMRPKVVGKALSRMEATLDRIRKAASEGL